MLASWCSFPHDDADLRSKLGRMFFADSIAWSRPRGGADFFAAFIRHPLAFHWWHEGGAAFDPRFLEARAVRSHQNGISSSSLSRSTPGSRSAGLDAFALDELPPSLLLAYSIL